MSHSAYLLEIFGAVEWKTFLVEKFGMLLSNVQLFWYNYIIFVSVNVLGKLNKMMCERNNGKTIYR